MLEIDCRFSDSYLAGHALRVGLAGDQTSPSALERLLPTIRNDIHFELDRLRDAGFDNYSRLSEDAGTAENAAALGRFLSLPPEQAQRILQLDYLFAD